MSGTQVFPRLFGFKRFYDITEWFNLKLKISCCTEGLCTYCTLYIVQSYCKKKAWTEALWRTKCRASTTTPTTSTTKLVKCGWGVTWQRLITTYGPVTTTMDRKWRWWLCTSSALSSWSCCCSSVSAWPSQLLSLSRAAVVSSSRSCHGGQLRRRSLSSLARLYPRKKATTSKFGFCMKKGFLASNLYSIYCTYILFMPILNMCLVNKNCNFFLEHVTLIF